MNKILNRFNSRLSGKLKLSKLNVQCLSQYPSEFSNPVEKLSSLQSGRVADLPNNPPNSRELLGNDCSVTSRSVLRILISFAVFISYILFLSAKIVVALITTSENRRSGFRAFLVVAKIQGRELSLFSNEISKITFVTPN